MVAYPDPSTFTLLPWRAGAGGTARMFCDIKQPNGEPFDGDPRNVLRKVVAKAEALGYTMYVRPGARVLLLQGQLRHRGARPRWLLRPHHPRRR